MKNISRHGVFEVFSSGGAWALLFGKPLLEAFNAIHDYSPDIVRIPRNAEKKEWVVLENQFASNGGHAGNLLANLTIDIKQRIDASGDNTLPPSREVSHVIPSSNIQFVDCTAVTAEERDLEFQKLDTNAQASEFELVPEGRMVVEEHHHCETKDPNSKTILHIQELLSLISLRPLSLHS